MTFAVKTNVYCSACTSVVNKIQIFTKSIIMFCLKDSEEFYLCLSEQPKRFDADSPVTNVFFDDTNGQVNSQYLFTHKTFKKSSKL